MSKRIGVTASEMLQMREQGLINHDIAKSLDISYPTVVRYIGKQGKRMESLEAFRDTPVVKETKSDSIPSVPEYSPKPTEEVYHLGGFRVALCHADRIAVLTSAEYERVAMSYDQIPDLVQVLAWAMRTRMEVKQGNGEEDQL